MEIPPLFVLWGKAGCRRHVPDAKKPVERKSPPETKVRYSPSAKRTAPEISPGPFTVCDLLPPSEGAALHLVHGGDRRSGAGP